MYANIYTHIYIVSVRELSAQSTRVVVSRKIELFCTKRQPIDTHTLPKSKHQHHKATYKHTLKHTIQQPATYRHTHTYTTTPTRL